MQLMQAYRIVQKSGHFDPDFYATQQAGDLEDGTDVLVHYLETGYLLGLRPNADFDPALYRNRCEAAGEAFDNPLVHYLSEGREKGLSPYAEGITRQALSRMVTDPSAMPDSGRDARPDGFLDFYGFLEERGAWVFCGWAPIVSSEKPLGYVEVKYGERRLRGEAMWASFTRTDIGAHATGIVVFAIIGPNEPGEIEWLALDRDDESAILCPAHGMKRIDGGQLATRVREVLADASDQQGTRELLNRLPGEKFRGQDSFGAISESIRFEIEYAIECGVTGIVIIGWALARPDSFETLSVCSGSTEHILDFERCIWVERPDVLSTLQHDFPSMTVRCGFVAFVPGLSGGKGPLHIKLKALDGTNYFRPFARSDLTGLAAIRRILASFEVLSDDVLPAFENVVGQPVEALNISRLSIRPRVSTKAFGEPPDQPKISIIVPLYGRMDFLEYQLALFSAHPAAKTHEYLYVLDQPERARELERLAFSAFERFRIPFSLLISDRNSGFAVANNIGIERARGEHVCLLNSDVFPGSADWAERLSNHRDADANLGAVGPVLLFEDGSVQHQGMQIEPVSEFGQLAFPIHLRKGRRPESRNTLETVAAITAACMMLRKSTLDALGGLDERYVIGDFEDADLCYKLAKAGLRCAVDSNVRLYHLERQSQAGPEQIGRSNITLYNAWQFHRRWNSGTHGSVS